MESTARLTDTQRAKLDGITAARAAAWDAAWDAARDAARDAAWAAARAALQPIVTQLQASAVHLIREMCAIGRVEVAQ